MKPGHESLRALGLSEYAARAYGALVALGPAPAVDVATAAPVPRTKVYSVLSELARRGWVEAEPGRPKRFRAKPPRECFERERAMLNAKLDVGLPELEEQFRERSRKFAGPLWLLEGADVVAERSLEMMNAAREDVLLVASFALPGDEKAFARAAREAVRRGVRVRVAAGDADAPHVRALARAGAEVRGGLFLPPRLLAVDNRQALIAFPTVRADGALDVKAMWNPSPELMSLVGSVLISLWMSAEPVTVP